MFMRKLAFLMILIGGGVALYNGYQWWDQAQLVHMNPKLARQIAKDWEDRTYQKGLAQGEKPNWEPKKGEKIGELIIPRIGAILPIVEGTEAEELAKGVGHYVGYGTVMPGETGHVVLSGHRDTVFREVGKLQTGDRIYAKLKNGKTFTYQIRKTWITHAEDRTVIVPHSKPILSLTTCYPFDYVGDAPDRYIIRAELISTSQGDRRG
jgi:sortase A